MTIEPTKKVIYFMKGHYSNWAAKKMWKDCTDEEKKEANLMEIPTNIVLLDYESDKEYKIGKKLIKENNRYAISEVWETHSKEHPGGKHIILEIADLSKYDIKIRNEIRRILIKRFKADLQVCSEIMFIPIPNKPHYKSGKIYNIVGKRGYINMLEDSDKNIIEEAKKTLKKTEQFNTPLQTDKNFEDYFEEDPFWKKLNTLNWSKMPMSCEFNNRVSKNLAIACAKSGKTKEEIDEIMKPFIQKIKGYMYAFFEGWLRPAIEGRFDDYNYYELNNWSKKYLGKEIYNTIINPYRFFEVNNKGAIIRFIPKIMGDFIKTHFTFKTIAGNDKQVYFYKNGYYHENGFAIIKKYTTKFLNNFFKKHYVEETEAYIRNTTYINVNKLNHDWINLKNGLLNPITKEFKQHTPDIFCLHQLDIIYNSDAQCPEFEKQLKIKCPEDIKFKTVQEMFGYCLSEDQRYEKAFLLFGDRRSFISTLLFVLQKLLGDKSVEAIPLQDLETDKYAAAHLFGKLANICADLSPRELWNTGTFMKITGQDLITSGKKFEQQITFAPFATLVFSCNIVPPTTNKTLAFYRRWTPLEFNVQTLKGNVNINMRTKLLKELSGILVWALTGLTRLLENNKFSYDPTDAEIKDFYEKYSDTIQSFIFNEISIEYDNVAEKKREVYPRYVKYCKKNKLTPENLTKFGRTFKLLTGSGEKRIGKIPAYAGVIFKNKIEEYLKDKKGEKDEQTTLEK